MSKAIIKSLHISPTSPRDFFVLQIDKHSDSSCVPKNYGNGCCCGFSPRFPYPLTYCHAVCPTTDAKAFRLLEEKLISRRDFIYPHTIACRIPAKLSVSTLKEGFLDEDDGAALLRSDSAITLKAPRFLSPDTPEENNPARKGSATHAVMQFCDFSFAEANGAHAEIARQKKLGFLSANDAELADAAAIDRFFQSALYSEIKHARSIHRERRFMITLPASSFTQDKGALEEDLLVQGVIDCFFADANDRIWLVDYKTDRFASSTSAEDVEKELIRRHSAQMHYYKEALRRLCGKEVFRAVIYSFHLNRGVVLPNEI